jgi:hypothetical protein
VIDYAGSYIQTVKSLLSYFDEKARTHQCKIRVLLLERNTKTPNNWYETLTSGSGNTLANFEHLISNTNILNLKPLSDEAICLSLLLKVGKSGNFKRKYLYRD